VRVLGILISVVLDPGFRATVASDLIVGRSHRRTLNDSDPFFGRAIMVQKPRDAWLHNGAQYVSFDRNNGNTPWNISVDS
jgi:hypothetical protein